MSFPQESENPLMALVNAATSMMEKSAAAMEKDSSKSAPPAVVPSSDSEETSNSQRSAAAVHSNSKKFSFAEHLMNVLEDGEKPGSDPSLVWMPNGMAFTIVNPKKFTAVEMPKLFQIRNMSSFVRKLGRWGFHRVHEASTKNSDIFKHVQFQRGNRDLCGKIKCVSGAVAPSPPSTPASPRNRVITVLNKEPRMVQPKSDQGMALPRKAKEAIGNQKKKSGLNATLLARGERERKHKNTVKSFAPLLGEKTKKSPQTSPMVSSISHHERSSPISAQGTASNHYLSAALENMRRESYIEEQAVARAGYMAATSSPSLTSATNALAMEYLFKTAVSSHHQQEIAAQVAAASTRLPHWMMTASTADHLYVAAMNERGLPGAATWGRGFPTPSLFR